MMLKSTNFAYFTKYMLPATENNIPYTRATQYMLCCCMP